RIDYPVEPSTLITASGYQDSIGFYVEPDSGLDITYDSINDRFVFDYTGSATGLPAGTEGQILRHDGADWVPSSILNIGTEGLTSSITANPGWSLTWSPTTSTTSSIGFHLYSNPAFVAGQANNLYGQRIDVEYNSAASSAGKYVGQ